MSRLAAAGLILVVYMGIGGMSACVPAPTLPPPSWPPLTRIAAVHTATPTLSPPPSSTPTITPVPTATSSVTPPPLPSATPLPLARLMAVGDVMLARSIGERIEDEGAGLPIAAVASVLQEADLLAANLECVIAGNGVREAGKRYTFRAPLKALDTLALAGVDVISAANNHSLDYGYAALADMRRRLDERGVYVVGAGANAAAARAPVILRRNGLRVAFLAYVDVPVESRTGFDTRTWIAGADTPGVAWAVVEDIAADVAAARASADVVVVLLHFGLEGRSEITSAQRRQARAAIDAGAALVLGSGTHVLQGAEVYGNGLIVYNLGNFIFDEYGFPENYSVIFTATLSPAGVQDYNWIPIVIEAGLPRLATADEAPAILDRLRLPAE